MGYHLRMSGRKVRRFDFLSGFCAVFRITTVGRTGLDPQSPGVSLIDVVGVFDHRDVLVISRLYFTTRFAGLSDWAGGCGK